MVMELLGPLQGSFRDMYTKIGGDECSSVMCEGHVLAGIAHLLEHMAFKGSQRIGARNYKREAVLLDEVDDGTAPSPITPLATYNMFHCLMAQHVCQVHC